MEFSDFVMYRVAKDFALSGVQKRPAQLVLNTTFTLSKACMQA